MSLALMFCATVINISPSVYNLLVLRSICIDTLLRQADWDPRNKQVYYVFLSTTQSLSGNLNMFTKK